MVKSLFVCMAVVLANLVAQTSFAQSCSEADGYYSNWQPEVMYFNILDEDMVCFIDIQYVDENQEQQHQYSIQPMRLDIDETTCPGKAKVRFGDDTQKVSLVAPATVINTIDQFSPKRFEKAVTREVPILIAGIELQGAMFAFTCFPNEEIFELSRQEWDQ